ncbi:MAG: gamma-glutamyl-gamma-aminobutyrate hydrolase family protein [Peptococcia bacterium]
MTPIIGITCSWQEEKKVHNMAATYIEAVLAAGGVPLIIPSQPKDKAETIYAAIDGLILAGGPDLDPWHFGEEPQKDLGVITPLRDQLELELSRLALVGNKPVLAICRGIQVLNVAAGGTIYQDISGLTQLKHSQEAPRWHPTHGIQIAEESSLFTLAGQTHYRVNSFHHQAIAKVGQGLRAVAWARDKLVEAVENLAGDGRIRGVQWHPEGSWQQDQLSLKLFSDLVLQAKSR